MTDLVTEVFGFRVPMTPAVILPTLAFATILAAYLVYFVVIRIMRAVLKKSTVYPAARVEAPGGT